MADEKPTNPKDAIGIRKAPFSALPWRVLWMVGLAMLEGAAKYGRHNYRAVGVRASVYFDAIVARHLSPWWEGEDVDPDSQLHHLDKALSALMVLRDSILQGNLEDDRPPRRLTPPEPGSTEDLSLRSLNARAAAILDSHADKNPKHYTWRDC